MSGVVKALNTMSAGIGISAKKIDQEISDKLYRREFYKL